MITRRQFLKLGAAVGAGAMLPLELAEKAFAFNLLGQAMPANPLLLTKYVDPLPVMGVMPQAGPNYYEVGAYEIATQIHSQMPATTKAWAYRAAAVGPATENTYLGRSFVAQKGTPIQVKWTNDLVDALGSPLAHPMPVDPTLHWANPLGYDPAADAQVTWDPVGMRWVYPTNALGQSTFDYTLTTVPLSPHVHGGEQRAASDGHPDAWFTPGWAVKGPAWMNQVFTYDNGQPAATLWYHDHALGITRLNVYMGLAGAYVLTDPGNEPAGLPSGTDAFANPLDVPLVIQDRIFDVNGQLYYPAISDNPSHHPFWVPEFFGDTILVNGRAWPRMDVEPRAYRFRFLNGSNARFYDMWLEDMATATPGPKFTQIATDGGYMPTPAVLNDPAVPGSPRLVLAPGERAEIVIDFSSVAPGTALTLKNTARSPFPKGAPADPQTTGQIMRFRVGGATQPAYTVPANPNPGFFALGAASRTRLLTLNEVMGVGGPLMALLNNTPWHMPVTEMPKQGATEDWTIVNLTGDAHPIHLHLVQFQLVSRHNFNVNKYVKAYAAAYPGGMVPMHPMGPPPAGNPPIAGYLQGPAMPPNPNEVGWKDTVIMYPGQVTTIKARFAPIDTAAPTSYPFDPKAAPGYVWHCHILDHEDNEMMRPYTVVP